MIIQVVGFAAYFIGKLISNSKPSFIINWLNIIIVSFMPISLIATFAFKRVIAPYPTDIMSGFAFIVVCILIIISSFFALKKLEK
ncbi:hypothetical protein [Tissierella sp.]|uniref:hypothetical protein n=1 Tax=Tissierella sp. TaxID=41274 RepID=UPI00285DEEEA|nr:hypothetical protein [Tissierella sp.]MDR7855400.1 hypothetical protein [Tissierella sp.]